MGKTVPKQHNWQFNYKIDIKGQLIYSGSKVQDNNNKTIAHSQHTYQNYFMINNKCSTSLQNDRNHFL